MQDLECLAQIPSHLPQIIKYSGRYMFRFGKYHQCINATNMDYYFLGIAQKGLQGYSIFYGGCLPYVCKNTTVQSGLNNALQKANIPLTVNLVINRIETYQYPFTLQFFITLIILVALFTAVIIGSCSKTMRRHQIMGAFSVQNTTKIFKYQEGSRLNVLNGVRSLAMFWVILGHSLTMPIGGALNILSVQKNILSDWKFLVVQAGLYAVDTFFFIGGFLIAYSFIKDQTKSNMKYILAIINRILRFWPAYFVAIMIYYVILPHTNTGPFWRQDMAMSELCHTLWRPLFFVDNLVQNGNNMCMGWGWYIQNDMQLFIYCILILLVYSKSKFWGFSMIFISLAANFAYVMSETYNHGYKWMTHLADALNAAQYQLDIYFKPWARCPPYIYGLLLGILYSQFLAYESKKKLIIKKSSLNSKNQQNQSEIKQNLQQLQLLQESEPFLYKMKTHFEQHPWQRRLFQFAGLFICLFISLIPRTNQGQDAYWPQFVHSIYLTYMKFIFVVGLSFIILPSLLLPATNKSLLIRFAMDTKAFNVIAKISFCTYLIHMTIMFWYLGGLKYDTYFTFLSYYVLFISFTVLSFVFGTVLVYVVQAPFTKLQKLFMGKLMNNMKNKQQLKQQKIQSNSQQPLLHKSIVTKVTMESQNQKQIVSQKQTIVTQETQKNSLKI